MEKESEVNAEAQDDLAIIWDLDDTMHLQGALELFDVGPCVQWMFLAMNITDDNSLSFGFKGGHLHSYVLQIHNFNPLFPQNYNLISSVSCY